MFWRVPIDISLIITCIILWVLYGTIGNRHPEQHDQQGRSAILQGLPVGIRTALEVVCAIIMAVQRGL